MNNNDTYFNCVIDNSCSLKIGYMKDDIGKIIFITISLLGALLNLIFIIYNLLKRNKFKNRKASMRKIFLIFPLTDFLTAIYWLISFLYLYGLQDIANKNRLCSLAAVFYIELITFQFTLMNCLLIHFRKVNTNPIEGILKPNKNFIKYIIICILIGAIVNGFSELLGIIGRSPMNTCFINTKFSGESYFGYIFIIPVICIIIAIIQLVHDLFFVKMFNSDKGIRRIHRKNSLYVFVFCLLHIPFIIVMIISLIYKRNNYYIENDYSGNVFLYHFVKTTTILTCSIPLIMNILRQLQGLTRFECINDCLRKKRKSKFLHSSKTIKSFRKMTLTSSDPSMTSDPFEWLEEHVMEYFMRDILIGVTMSLKESKKYDVFSNEYMSVKPEDFKESIKYGVNLKDRDKYKFEDETIENTEYLDVEVIDYAPKVFAYLRKLEKIDIDKMIESFLPKNNKQGIKESQGKSGSFFISTDNNKYMIKTLKSDELELLKHVFLKEYVHHIEKNPDSLLCRLYGMYNIIFGQGDEILIIVMRNVIGDFKDNTIVKFDLKGSTYKRKANFDMNNNNNVLKDLDFNEFEKNIMLSLSSIERLREATKKDSLFLCKSGLMDYSLFLVKLTLSKDEAIDTFGEQIAEKQSDDFIQIISPNNKSKKNKKRVSYTGEGKNIDIEHYKQYLFPSLTQGTAYIISIIDYFQIFNFFKYMESSIKTGIFNKKNKMNAISCVDPKTYSERFIRYINNLTDFKTLLSDEIKEEKNEENSSDLDSEDDSEDDSFFKKQIDTGDFIGAKGEIFTTQTGEKTLRVEEYKFKCNTQVEKNNLINAITKAKNESKEVKDVIQFPKIEIKERKKVIKDLKSYNKVNDTNIEDNIFEFLKTGKFFKIDKKKMEKAIKNNIERKQSFKGINSGGDIQQKKSIKLKIKKLFKGK